MLVGLSMRSDQRLRVWLYVGGSKCSASNARSQHESVSGDRPLMEIDGQDWESLNLLLPFFLQDLVEQAEVVQARQIRQLFPQKPRFESRFRGGR